MNLGGGAMRVPDTLASTFAQMTMLRSCFFSPVRSLPPSAAENVLDQLLLQATCRGMQRRLFACGHAKVFRGQCVSHTGRGRLICVAAGTEEVKQLEREVRIGFGQKKRLESSERTDLSSPRFFELAHIWVNSGCALESWLEMYGSRMLGRPH